MTPHRGRGVAPPAATTPVHRTCARSIRPAPSPPPISGARFFGRFGEKAALCFRRPA